MSTDFEDIYRMALRLPSDERKRLIDYLTNPPSSLSADAILSMLNAQADDLRQMGVIRIGVFGSHVRGEADPASDIDILVELREMSFFNGFMRVKLYLEELLGRTVDLVSKEGLREELKPHILNEVIYAEGV